MICKIYGCRARFCGEGCAEGFRTDRRYGLIYSSFLVELEDGSKKIMGVEQASIECDFCAYCNAPVARIPKKKVPA